MKKLFRQINSFSKHRMSLLTFLSLFLLGVVLTCNHYFRKQELTASLNNAKLKAEEQRQQDITYKNFCELYKLSEEIGKFYSYPTEGLIPNLINSQIRFEKIHSNLKESYSERPTAEIGQVIKIAEFFERFCEQKSEAALRIVGRDGNHTVDLYRLKRNYAKAEKLLKEFDIVSINYCQSSKNTLSQSQKETITKNIKGTFEKDIDKYFLQLKNLGDRSKVLMYPTEWPHISMYLSINDLI